MEKPKRLMEARAAVGVTEPETALDPMDNCATADASPKGLTRTAAIIPKILSEAATSMESPLTWLCIRRKAPGLDGRTKHSRACQASQKVRKHIEEIFGWKKTTGALRKSRYKGYVAAACNLVRMAKLMEESPPLTMSRT